MRKNVTNYLKVWRGSFWRFIGVQVGVAKSFLA